MLTRINVGTELAILISERRDNGLLTICYFTSLKLNKEKWEISIG
jgi:hypothetical protein